MVPHWINEITEKAMKELIELEKPYKFIVTVMLMENRGAGHYTTYSCLWENYIDGIGNKLWPAMRGGSKDQAG